MKAYWAGYTPYIKFGNRTWFPPPQRWGGFVTPYIRSWRHEFVGGTIYKGKFRICDYRAPKIFDKNYYFQKTSGNKIELLKYHRG